MAATKKTLDTLAARSGTQPRSFRTASVTIRYRFLLVHTDSTPLMILIFFCASFPIAVSSY